MKAVDRISLLGLIISGIGSLVGVLGGLVTPFVGSVAGVAIAVLVWMSWITARVLRLERSPEAAGQKALLLSPPSLPDVPQYADFRDRIVRVSSLYDKVKIPSSFFSLPQFTILFWVEITEEFFRTHNNRYLFSYMTNSEESSGYPNGFYLRIVGKSTRWQFCIKGSDPSNKTEIVFASSRILLGWKLFAVRWRRETLALSIDAGHCFQDSRAIPVNSWPQPDPRYQFHLGGWQDTWAGGLSELRFYNFRLFTRCLSDGDLETVYEREFGPLKSA